MNTWKKFPAPQFKKSITKDNFMSFSLISSDSWMNIIKQQCILQVAKKVKVISIKKYWLLLRKENKKLNTDNKKKKMD